MIRKPHYPDPNIQHGPFRVLPQTTGGFVVMDERCPVGDAAVKNKSGEVMRWRKAGEAGDVAAEWQRLGFGSALPPSTDRASASTGRVSSGPSSGLLF